MSNLSENPAYGKAEGFIRNFRIPPDIHAAIGDA